MGCAPLPAPSAIEGRGGPGCRRPGIGLQTLTAASAIITMRRASAPRSKARGCRARRMSRGRCRRCRAATGGRSDSRPFGCRRVPIAPRPPRAARRAGRAAGVGIAQPVKIDGRINSGRVQAALSGRCCSDATSAEKQTRAAGLSRDTLSDEIASVWRQYVNTAWRDLPLLLDRTRSVPTSGLKSSTVIAASSP